MKEERKQRQAQKAIDGAAGLAEYQAAAAAQLKNMARLRAERIARADAAPPKSNGLALAKTRRPRRKKEKDVPYG